MDLRIERKSRLTSIDALRGLVELVVDVDGGERGFQGALSISSTVTSPTGPGARATPKLW